MRNFPLVLAAIIMPSCAAIVIASVVGVASSRSSLDAARLSLHEAKVAEAYSCAYLAGQYATMNAIPALFSGTKEVPGYCEPFRTIAAKRGFKP